MSAFKDSDHHWWQQCSACSMAWFIGDAPEDEEAEEECERCSAPALTPPTPADVARDVAVIRGKFRRDHQPAGDQYGGLFYHDGQTVDPWEAVSRLEAAATRVPGLDKALTETEAERNEHEEEAISLRSNAARLESERDAARERAEVLEQSERDLSGHVANLERVLAAERESLRLCRESAEGFRNERDAARQEVATRTYERDCAQSTALERGENITRITEEHRALTARVAELESLRRSDAERLDGALEGWRKETARVAELERENERLSELCSEWAQAADVVTPNDHRPERLRERALVLVEQANAQAEAEARATAAEAKVREVATACERLERSHLETAKETTGEVRTGYRYAAGAAKVLGAVARDAATPLATTPAPGLREAVDEQLRKVRKAILDEKAKPRPSQARISEWRLVEGVLEPLAADAATPEPAPADDADLMQRIREQRAGDPPIAFTLKARPTPAGLLEAVGKVLGLWAKQDTGSGYVTLATWQDAHTTLRAAYDAAKGGTRTFTEDEVRHQLERTMPVEVGDKHSHGVASAVEDIAHGLGIAVALPRDAAKGSP